MEPSAAHATDDTKLVVYDMSDLVIAFEADPPVADEDAQGQRERAQRQADRLDLAGETDLHEIAIVEVDGVASHSKNDIDRL